MVSKEQKFNRYSSSLKDEIINGLSRKYDVPDKTISTRQQKLKHLEKYLEYSRKIHRRPKEKI